MPWSEWFSIFSCYPCHFHITQLFQLFSGQDWNISFLPQNRWELSVSHFPRRILGCAYTTCPYGKSLFACTVLGRSLSYPAMPVLEIFHCQFAALINDCYILDHFYKTLYSTSTHLFLSLPPSVVLSVTSCNHLCSSSLSSVIISRCFKVLLWRDNEKQHDRIFMCAFYFYFLMTVPIPITHPTKWWLLIVDTEHFNC